MSPTSQRRAAPATASTPKTVAESTSIVPRSGWSRISAAGTPAMTSIPSTSGVLTPRRHRPSLRSATSRAMPITTASLANSDGWIDMPPSWSHEREPLMVRAGDQHADEADDRAEVDQRRQDPHPAVVGGQHHHHQHQADGDVDQLLAQVRRGVAAGEVRARRGGRPDQQGADDDQAERRRPSAASRARGPAAAGSADGRAGARVLTTALRTLDGRRQDRAVVEEGRQRRRGDRRRGWRPRAGATVSPSTP